MQQGTILNFLHTNSCARNFEIFVVPATYFVVLEISLVIVPLVLDTIVITLVILFALALVIALALVVMISLVVVVCLAFV